jgi:uncharacterized protein
LGADQVQKRLLSRLLDTLEGPVAVGLSGGTDSAFLLASALKYCPDRVVPVTAVTPFLSWKELGAARDVCRELGTEPHLINVSLLDEPEITFNGEARCYFCKRRIYQAIKEYCRQAFGGGQVLDGTNLDDLSRHRPGLRALKELGIATPLAEAGLTKRQIRQMARQAGYSFWDRRSFSCLATALPSGMRIEPHRLRAMGSCYWEFLSF